jgi:DNA-directed RNA polymerase subunit RPC12/RpoP
MLGLSHYILTLGAVIGGVWLSAEILKSLTKYYKCPYCGYEIKKAGQGRSIIMKVRRSRIRRVQNRICSS